MPTCNTTLEDAHIVEAAIAGNLTFHHLGLMLSAIFGLISVLVSMWLIVQHATHYQRPNQQKQIIRILFMIPVYAVVSFLSYLFYRKAIYFEVLRDCYEAFAISSFFALMCDYIAPNLHDQKEYFRSVHPVNWFWGVFGLQKCTGGQTKGPLRKPRSGLTWFNVIWAGIFQYCVVRVLFTIVSVVSEALGRYCGASLNPAFAHVWVLVFESLSVTVAMFMLIQFYIQLKNDLAEHKPFLKVLSIKLVIFFSFWQTIVISFLSSDSGPLKPTKTLAYQDIKIGIPSVLLCIEMAFFSILHVFAYPWAPYSAKHLDPVTADVAGRSGYKGGPMGVKAVMDAFNPWDIIKAIARGFRWMFVGSRHREHDFSYQPAKSALDGTAYMGPTYAATGQAATELQTAQAPRLGRADTYATEDARAGLLGHSQMTGRVEHSSCRDDECASCDDRHVLGGSPPRVPPRAAPPSAGDVTGLDMKPSDFENEDTGYHPGTGRPPRSSIAMSVHGNVHPALRTGQAPPPQNGAAWDHWAGIQQDNDAASVGRQPTDRTHGPYS